jgi:hypothetical protein
MAVNIDQQRIYWEAARVAVSSTGWQLGTLEDLRAWPTMLGCGNANRKVGLHMATLDVVEGESPKNPTQLLNVDASESGYLGGCRQAGEFHNIRGLEDMMVRSRKAGRSLYLRGEGVFRFGLGLIGLWQS